MNKSKKIAIGLLATFGTSLLISVPLIILSCSKTKNTVEEIKENKTRYKLSNWIIKQNKQTELFSYFFASQDLLKNKINFDEKNIDKYKIQNFFKNIIFEIFKYSKEEYEINLKIDYEINKTYDQCKLNLNWYFLSKNHNIILKNHKYYDILMLYF